MSVLTFACIFIMPSFTPLNINSLENSQFLLSVDNDARIFIDTKEEGIVTKNEFKIFKVFPGQHIIEARSLDGTGKYRKIHRVEEGHQEIIEIKLLPSDESIGLVGKFIDPRDNQEYRTVIINGKTWLAENLKYNTFRSWCNANDNNNCIKFGRLYHFDYAKSAIPKGWHLPTRKEWEDLLTLYTNGTIIQDLKQGGKSNFDLLFGGRVFVRMSNNGIFESHNLNTTAEFWIDESTAVQSHNEIVNCFKFSESGFTVVPVIARQHKGAYGSALSIRCVKD